MQKYVHPLEIDEFVEVTIKINLREFATNMIDSALDDLGPIENIDIEALKLLISEDIKYRVFEAEGQVRGIEMLEYLADTGYEDILEF